MLKRKDQYEDFDGNIIVEEFYFNLTEAEITEMELEIAGGLSAYLQRISDSKNVPDIIEAFKMIIKKAYGVKSADGRRMIKSPELFDEFKQTNAYSNLFMELSTDADKASAFINGIVPKRLLEARDKQELNKVTQ